LRVGRVVRDMLSGVRPKAPALVRIGRDQPAWFVEPTADEKTPLVIYGAGHVGRALVRVLDGLPFAVTWVDTARERFPEEPTPSVVRVATSEPAEFAASFPAGAYHIVMTFSHALDLAICHAVLARGDFAHLGLIGSATKRARFVRRLGELGVGVERLERLVCPIGQHGLAGKAPAVIAVSVAADLLERAAKASAMAVVPPTVTTRNRTA
jgi:xanthine dehydrogenase accessory factor